MTDENSEQYLAAEAKVRVEIDSQLVECCWVVQDANAVNLTAGVVVAVREFILIKDHGRADYPLFVDGPSVGAIEADGRRMRSSGSER